MDYLTRKQLDEIDVGLLGLFPNWFDVQLESDFVAEDGTRVRWLRVTFEVPDDLSDVQERLIPGVLRIIQSVGILSEVDLVSVHVRPRQPSISSQPIIRGTWSAEVLGESQWDFKLLHDAARFYANELDKTLSVIRKADPQGREFSARLLASRLLHPLAVICVASLLAAIAIKNLHCRVYFGYGSTTRLQFEHGWPLAFRAGAVPSKSHGEVAAHLIGFGATPNSTMIPRSWRSFASI